MNVDLANFKGMTSLEGLFLIGFHVTDAGLENIKPLVNLRSFEVWSGRSVGISANIEVTDAGLASFRPLVDLEVLSLEAPKLTDAGIVQLTGLRRLKMLKLDDNSSITVQGRRGFARRLPIAKSSSSRKHVALTGRQLDETALPKDGWKNAPMTENAA